MQMLYYQNGAYPYESVLGISWGIRVINYFSASRFSAAMGVENLNFEKFLALPQYCKNPLPGCKHHAIDLHYLYSYCPDFLALNPEEGVRFCSACIKFGYHSVFWMIKSVRKCHLHGLALSLACRSCINSLKSGGSPGKCQYCGFEFVDPSRQINFRRSIILRYEMLMHGRKFANWYRTIHEAKHPASSCCKKYFQLELSDGASNELVVAVEKLLGEKSPHERESAVGAYNGSWVDIGVPPSEMTQDSLDYHSWRKQIFQMLSDIEARYLSKHRECYKDIDRLLGYSDGKSKRCLICPLSLAYALLRLSLACEVWPTPTSVSPSKSCFDFFMHLASLWGIPLQYQKRLINSLFLALLGEIQLSLDLGESKTLSWHSLSIIRNLIYGERLIYLRRSRFYDRVRCLDPIEIDCHYHVFRDGRTGRVDLELSDSLGEARNRAGVSSTGIWGVDFLTHLASKEHSQY